MVEQEYEYPAVRAIQCLCGEWTTSEETWGCKCCEETRGPCCEKKQCEACEDMVCEGCFVPGYPKHLCVSCATQGMKR